MPSSHHILEDFIIPISACSQEANLDDVLDVVQFSQSPTIAVVDREKYPLGIVNGHRLLTFLVKQGQTVPQNSTKQTNSLGYEPISTCPSNFVRGFELNAWIEPIVSLKSNLSREQVLLYFDREIISKSEQQHYLVVNPEGNLLGLLDTFRLSQWLFFTQVKNSSSSQHQANNVPTFDSPLFNLIEQIPIPLRLQAQSGKALYENQYWREKVRTSLISSPLEITDFVDSFLDLQRFKLTNDRPKIKDEFTPYCQKGNYYLSSSFANLSQQKITFDSRNIIERVIQKPIASPVQLKQDEQQKPSVLELDVPASLTKKSNNLTEWQYLKLPLGLRNYQASSKNLPAQVWLLIGIEPNQQKKSPQEHKSINLNCLKKNEFWASIGHDLKSPLTSIIGLSSLLKEQKTGQLNQRQTRYAELIYRSGRQLMKIVNDILELTILSNGKLQLNLEPIKIKSLCDEAYEQVFTRLEELSKIEEKALIKPKFELVIEPGLDTILADRVRLRQILIYLLDNALKFIQGQETSFSQPKRNIEITINYWSSWVAINICDNGIGIKEEVQHLILERHFSSEHSCDYNYQNAGLGLILAQQLTRAHGGDISFVSSWGRGSRFTVLLPTSPQKDYPELASNSSLRQSLELSYHNYHNQRQSSESTIATKENLLVLVIESVVANINKLDWQLRKLGYYPIIARTDLEALHKARQLKPSKILLNPALSRSYKTDLLSLLKADACTCKISVFLLVADSQSEPSNYSQADGLITLPIEQKKLREFIPPIKKDFSPVQKRLTILHLYPESEITSNLKIIRNSDLNFALNEHLSGLNHRVLEADSLEQGELLARIWQLDAIVLDGSIIKEPLNYLRSLRELENLSSLPLVTLDAQTTAAANLVEGLSVFPCLLPEPESSLANLVQVIQIAAGIRNS